MPVPSLANLAKTRLVQNIHMLEDIGDIPYAFLAPVLRQIQIPEQLVQLEANCPHIQGETGEIWLRLIKRDIPGWDKKPHQPRDPKNWSKVYKKLKKEAAAEEEAQQEALRQKMQALQKDRNGHQTTIINANLNLPSARRSGWSFGGGQRSGWGDPAAPKKTGKAAFDKLKRGIYDAKRARPKASMMPQHILNERKRTVTQVPARMVRMAEAEAISEAPKRMLVPKAASASVAGGNATRRPIIRQQPMPRLGDAASERAAARPRLPAGQHFSAPRPVPKSQPSASGASLKRSRSGPNILVEPKRKKV
ncbi:hypothetical protein SLS60_009759 [Paraconiothyrium brasiliense]|uniref:RNA polymerase II transcription factor SIII subunit A n=1 Tax=Paraconiothyrium brasiliense TaxID=300254 RepID=A0ABR3QSE9_9PLEO